jgi:hypothetical protein
MSGGTDLSPLDDLKALFEEVQVLCGGFNDDLPDASIEDGFSDERASHAVDERPGSRTLHERANRGRPHPYRWGGPG